MRLLVVTQYFWPENFRINELVQYFVEKGHEVIVLTGWPNYPDGNIDQVFKKNPSNFNIFQGARIVRVPLIPRGQSRWSLALNYLSFALTASTLGMWKLRGQKVDVILAYQPSPVFIGFPGALLRWVKGVPMAFWILDLWPESLKAVGVVKSKWLLGLLGLIVRWIYKRCDLILVQSQRFVENIQKYAPPHLLTAYFPAWTDDVFTIQETTEPAVEVPYRPDLFTVMFAGNIGDAQDFPAILQAVELLRDKPQIRWVIVGDGRMAEWMRQQIQQRQLGNQILMVGRFPLDRMPSFFAHANAMLVSLKDEPIFALTIPGKVQAYLGSGLPVLAMLTGEGARIVEEAQAGLISPASDGKALAANVLKMSSMSKVELGCWGQNGKQFAEAQFDKKMLLNKLEYCLHELVQKNERITH
jgi:glycosyltransferase involved in cell wall biosynthesis